jgi:hypothetical protein
VTGAILFLRSRRVGGALLVLMVAAMAARLVRDRTFGVGASAPLTVPWATLLPLVQAGIAASVAISASPVAERAAARRVEVVQMVAVAALAAVAATLNAWSVAGVSGPLTAAGFDRNLCGLLGLALISARLLGAALLWVLPVLATVTSLALGGPGRTSQAWAWVVQPDASRLALVVALGLLVVGLAASWRVFDRRSGPWG